MAVIKHIANKNADYGESLNYLLFQHNEQTGKPILDEQGRFQLRTEYYIDGINCDPMSFDQECEKVNAYYRKNQNYDEIKTHHYIISFDPRDSTENGLTGERAQTLGVEYAKKYFPGHQILVVTHTDGHNKSGNIHVHIVLNSVRKYDVPKEEFMERACDSKAGYKHHTTEKFFRYLQKKVMEMCEKEGLYQIDIFSPAAQKISQSEYWANRRGQEKLNQINQEIIEDGLTPAETTFQTQKQFLRNAIDETLPKSHTFEEFRSLLLENYGIATTESRGRYSYQHPDREKSTSSRSLGTHYSKEYVTSHFGIEAPMKSAPDYHKDPIQILYFKSDFRLVVDLQKCVKAQQSQAYARKVKISNLQQMANTIIYVQEHQYDTKEMLDNTLLDLTNQKETLLQDQKQLQAQLTTINRQIHFTGQYYSNKSTFTDMIHAVNKALYRQEHLKEISAYEEARAILKNLNPNGKMPSMKSLKEEKSEIVQKLENLKNPISDLKSKQKEIQIIHDNVETILDLDAAQKGKEKEAEL